jgi:hypothetical protein
MRVLMRRMSVKYQPLSEKEDEKGYVFSGCIADFHKRMR